jgi:hypothetical protein
MDIESLLAAMFPCLRIIREIKDTIFGALYKVLYLCGLANINSGPAGWQFCSELVANVYQSIGVLSQSFNSKNILPVDFFGYNEIPALVQHPILIQD